MNTTFDINGHKVMVSRDAGEKAFVSRQLRFVNEASATFYLPFHEGVFIQGAESYLQHLSECYETLRPLAFAAIGKMAFAGNYWGKQLSEAPQMDLVWVRVMPKSFEGKNIHLELAFNDAVHDAYTLWVASFMDQTLEGVRRESW